MEPKTVAELVNEARHGSAEARDELVRRYYREAAVLATAMVNDTGRRVLAGQLDRVATCGIDRWLGGVHLQSDGQVWRWDDTRQRVAQL